jgi:hypothetical protein
MVMSVKTAFMVFILTAAAGISAGYACEMTFTLIGPSGASLKVLPGRSLDLVQGQQYTLRVEFYEDHNKCLHAPEETLFLIGDKKWKSGDTSMPLTLAAPVSWSSEGRTNTTEIRFTANSNGTTELEVIRECIKGGYDEALVFKVR